MYGWRRREDGAVLVYDLPNGPERAPMLAPDLRRTMDLLVERYGALNDAAADKHGIPRGWLDASELRESGGNARAFRQERHEDGTPIVDKHGRLLTGVGLNQITDPGIKGNYTDEQLFDPVLNIELAARHMASLIAIYGDDWPRVSAAYNAGSARPDPSNPWNLHQTAGHVSTEVSALNYYLLRKEADRQNELIYLEGVAVREQFDLASLVDVTSPLAPEDRETEPNPIREAVTMPDLAVLPRKPDDA